MSQHTRRITYANVASTLALAVALGGGGAYAAGLAKNSVASKQVKNHSIKGKDLKNGSVGAAAVADGSLGAGELASGAVFSKVSGHVVVRLTNVVLPAGPSAGMPGPPTAGFSTCAAGEQILGGSANIGNVTDPPSQEILATRPSVDTVGNGVVPEDGGAFFFWKGTGRTLTNVAGSMRVFAICLKP